MTTPTSGGGKFKFKVGDLAAFKTDPTTQVSIVERVYTEAGEEGAGVGSYSTNHYHEGSAVRCINVAEHELLTLEEADKVLKAREAKEKERRTEEEKDRQERLDRGELPPTPPSAAPKTPQAQRAAASGAITR